MTGRDPNSNTVHTGRDRTIRTNVRPPYSEPEPNRSATVYWFLAAVCLIAAVIVYYVANVPGGLP